jgi:predicted metalloprotease with PDZ domain
MQKTSLICACICLLHFWGFGQKATLKYAISPWKDADKSGLEVQLECKGAPNGYSKIYYQNNSWGRTNRWNNIKQFECLTPGTIVTAYRDSSFWLVQHKAGQKLHFKYALQQDFVGEIRDYYLPIFQDNYFHLFAQSLFVLPEHTYPDAKTALNISLVWEKFPQNWTLHNSFGHQPAKQSLYLKQSELMEGVFMGGTDFRFYPMKIQKNTAWLAIRGQWPATTDSQLVTILTKVFQTQRDFWNDHSQVYYSVSLIPVWGEWTEYSKTCGITGTGLTQSFAAGGTNNPCMDDQILSYLFNHELMHNWIGKIIAIQHEELQYWFSEGFTDYYTFKNMLVNGSLSPDAYCLKMNEDVFDPLYKSPYKSAPNYMIRDSFWLNEDLGKLPYRRGATFAFWLDNQIKLASNYEKSLNDLMLDLYREALKTAAPITDEVFLNKVQVYLNRDISSFFQKHIIVGEPIDFSTENISDVFILKKSKYGGPKLLLNEGVSKWQEKMFR